MSKRKKSRKNPLPEYINVKEHGKKVRVARFEEIEDRIESTIDRGINYLCMNGYSKDAVRKYEEDVMLRWCIVKELLREYPDAVINLDTRKGTTVSLHISNLGDKK